MEIVERCTKKGIEVVNVDGLKFMRKRKRTEKDPEQAGEPCGQPGVQANPGPEPTNTQATPGFDGTALAAASGTAQNAAFNTGSPIAHEMSEEQPSIAQTASQVPLSPEEDVGTEQPPGSGSPMAADGKQPMSEPAQPPVREQDLQAVVSNLLKFIPTGCPTAVAITWLLRETLRVAVPPGDEAGAATAATVLQSFQRGFDKQVAAAQQLLLLGDPEHLEQFDKLAPIVRNMCATERHVVSLKQQLEALRREEAEWLALEERYRSGACGICGEDATSLAVSGGDMEIEQNQEHVDVAVLESAQQRAELQLSLQKDAGGWTVGAQVDAINDMLDKAEFMVARAQQKCASMQAEYHKENFQSYAHVNSPQVLVKMLSQALPSAAMDFVPASQPGDD
ncbi:hypothetical protein VOLCADRAFT_104356 [Volvox carteri f. nagariensis]|uniref:Uncharacterized protein n=1 Tax=Volvox carteri f. nagariensis TaxID=3068 RepID=D8TT69_VOLCA|nr:uncharacterized protein VOLCADRAFT_104356 [Volvox carteri f. nagariensis]EFJ49259.1 hypothetical protein VOLCADRAFT_104356 [Volvox carteri f. nagariensis]|eukprot:XP_002949707.1 hypothetical protein VOLCADRAFT_104356 [Volvox carteri f. nagariensis]